MPLYTAADGDGHDGMAPVAAAGPAAVQLAQQRLKEPAERFLRLPPAVPPAGGGGAATLFVGQREVAIVERDDPLIATVGSDDATTCVIVALACDDAVLVAHLDGGGPAGVAGQLRQAARLLRRRFPNVSRYDAHVLGGYLCERAEHNRCAAELLDAMAACEHIHFVLRLALIGELNTCQPADGGAHGRPRLHGCQWHVATWRLMPAEFAVGQMGPMADLRHLASFCSRCYDLDEIYDGAAGTVAVTAPAECYEPAYAGRLADMPDEWILQHLSTSPHAERPHFAESTRRALRSAGLWRAHMRPHMAAFARCGRRVLFAWGDGKWSARDRQFAALQ